MSRIINSRSTSPGRGMSLLAGILIGMALGLIIAGAMAWYILKTPGSFVDNVPHEAIKPGPDAEKAAPKLTEKTASQPGEGDNGEDKPRFEFYKVLTDKPDATKPAPAQANSKPADKSATAASYFLQVGAFSNAEEADKLKARLAMLGVEASVEDANIADKTIHRVHLGPYSNEDDLKKMLAMLKQNGIDATPTRAQ